MNEKIFHTMQYGQILNTLSSHASTSIGKRAALALQPDTDLEHVKKLLQTTDEATLVDRLKGTPPFGGIVDISAAVSRARIGGTLNPSELLGIANTIMGGRRARRHIEMVHEENPVPMLADLVELISDQRPLEKAIRACIDDSAHVMDSASPELAAVRRELRSGEVRIREKLDSMIRSQSVAKMLQDQLVTIRGDRFVIPVKAEYRAHFGGIVHDQSGSGATLFIEPEAIVAMNNKLREAKLREEREIEVILQKLTAQVSDQVELLNYDIDILADLDFIFAKAKLARSMDATMPKMNDRGFLKLKKARHPLIPLAHVVPTDLELGNEHTSIIVTGPNTGGKTVTLKTVGLLSLMAMSGLFIPADEGSQLCVFDAIYADIGDEQSIEQNLSTFSSHMTNIISILEQMTPKSLVLFDELGAGTDPAEGSALAIAILEHIHSQGCRMIATTHFSELKAYAYDRKGVINASMEFDVNTLSPTYRLLIGVPGRSNAFAIASRLGLSEKILDVARGEVGEEDQRVENMIASLESNRLSAEEDRNTAATLRSDMEKLRGRYERDLARLEEQRDKRLEKADEEAREIIEKARKDADEVIRSLRQLAQEEGASVKDHKLIAARKQLDDATPGQRTKKKSNSSTETKKVKPLGPGDDVMVYSLNQRGLIVELSGTKEAVVQMGILKMKVALSDLELVQSAATINAQPQKKATTIKRSREDNMRSELDLRGANVEEGLMEVDRFLDEAFLANLGQIYIIHGKGTGVLRTGIQDFLRRHKHVKSFRTGEYNEGGNGVTVAVLK